MDLVLPGLMRETAPAGQGEALLHHPGQRLFIWHFKWEPEKKGGKGERGEKKKIRCISVCTSLPNTSIFSHVKRPFYFFLSLQDNSPMFAIFC